MFNNPMMCDAQDHIMANTWRLIFEGQSKSTAPNVSNQSPTDFSVLEQILPEYRFIGLCLADETPQRRYN